MNTSTPDRLTVLYDGDCPVCSVEMRWLKARDADARLNLVDIAAPGFDPQPYGVSLASMSAEIVGIDGDGRMHRGLATLRLAYAQVGLRRWVSFTGWIGLAPLFDAAYRWFARHRRTLSRWATPLVHWLEHRRFGASSPTVEQRDEPCTASLATQCQSRSARSSSTAIPHRDNNRADSGAREPS